MNRSGPVRQGRPLAANCLGRHGRLPVWHRFDSRLDHP